jgi:hypothetical protein
MNDIKNFLRVKLTECKISSIEEKLEKLHKMNLFFQLRFDDENSNKIRSKIQELLRRKAELVAAFENGL